MKGVEHAGNLVRRESGLEGVWPRGSLAWTRFANQILRKIAKGKKEMLHANKSTVTRDILLMYYPPPVDPPPANSSVGWLDKTDFFVLRNPHLYPKAYKKLKTKKSVKLKKERVTILAIHS